MDMQPRHRHAVWTCSINMYIDMDIYMDIDIDRDMDKKIDADMDMEVTGFIELKGWCPFEFKI
jgi:hypothetical protein